MKESIWHQPKAITIGCIIVIATTIIMVKYELIHGNWPLSINDVWIIVFPITKSDTIILHSILQSTATIFGVIIGLSIISIEHAAGNYTPKIIKIFAKDTFVIFTIMNNIMFIIFTAIIISGNLDHARLCIILFIYNIIILGFYLFYMMRMIDPVFLIQKIQFNTNKKIKYVGTNSDIKKNIENKKVFEINENESTIENIIYTSYRKHDHQTSNYGLSWYSHVIDEYINLRSDNIKQTDELINHFIYKIRSYGNQSLQDNNLVFLNQIIDTEKIIMTSMMKISSETNFTDMILNDLEKYAVKHLNEQNTITLNKIIKILLEVSLSCTNKNRNAHSFIHIIVQIIQKRAVHVDVSYYLDVMNNIIINKLSCNYNVSDDFSVISMLLSDKYIKHDVSFLKKYCEGKNNFVTKYVKKVIELDNVHATKNILGIINLFDRIIKSTNRTDDKEKIRDWLNKIEKICNNKSKFDHGAIHERIQDVMTK